MGSGDLTTWKLTPPQCWLENRPRHDPSPTYSSSSCTCWPLPLPGEATLGKGWSTSAQQTQARTLQEEVVPREIRGAPLFPQLAGVLDQVRGLGLVQRQELLQGALHGLGQLRDSRRVSSLCPNDAQGQHQLHLDFWQKVQLQEQGMRCRSALADKHQRMVCAISPIFS